MKDMNCSNSDIWRRNNTIDIIRLLFSFFVIAIHTALFSDFKYIFTVTLWVTSFAVPFFSIVSGYYLYSNFKKKGCGYTYLLKYGGHILLTYLLVCILLYPEQMLAQLRNQGYLWFDARFLLIDRAALGHLWYLIAIVIFVCLFAAWEYVASKLPPKVRRVADICIIILVFSLEVLFQASGNYYNLLNNPINNYVLNFPYDFLKQVFLEVFPFFAVGMLMCKYKAIVDSISIKNSKIILFVAITVSCVCQTKM